MLQKMADAWQRTRSEASIVNAEVELQSVPLGTAAELASLAPFTDPQYAKEADEIVRPYEDLLEPFARALGPTSEVVLHNFGRIPHSIVAVYGNVSGREVGGPATNMGLHNLMRQEPLRSRLGYYATMPNNAICRCSSVYLFGSYTQPVGAICVNTDVTPFLAVKDAVEALTGGLPSPQSSSLDSIDQPFPEAFYKTVDQAADHILQDTLRSAKIAPKLMSKSQKVNVVRMLHDRGFFLLKQSVGLTADALEVTRYTVYAYLNEAKLSES
jgi:predicted transcriptional regulator YheO